MTGKNRLKGSPIFLRDLSQQEQEVYLRGWKEKGETDLLKAHEDGYDITLGYYLGSGCEGVIE